MCVCVFSSFYTCPFLLSHWFLLFGTDPIRHTVPHALTDPAGFPVNVAEPMEADEVRSHSGSRPNADEGVLR